MNDHTVPRRCCGRTLLLIIVMLFPAFAFASSDDTEAPGPDQQSIPIGSVLPPPSNLNDVPANHWAYEAVERLTELGIIVGFPDQTFRGNENVTRFQIAVISARLIDYLDNILALFANDPEFIENLREAARDLREIRTFNERTERIENALEQAASLEYTQALEARIAALEQTLNEMLGEERFPGGLSPEGSSIPLSAAEVANGAAGFDSAADEDPAAGELQFRLNSPYPAYVGVSPGILSTTGQVYLGVQFGVDNIQGPFGVVGRLIFNSGVQELRLSADGIVRLTALTDNLEFYGGFGIGMSFRPEGNAFLIESPVGLEYLATPQVGLYLQLTPAYTFAPVGAIDANLTAGVNFRF